MMCFYTCQVQGMSFIAAVLLLNMDVDDAFICFANLLNRPCQIAFFRLDESLVSWTLIISHMLIAIFLISFYLESVFMCTSCCRWTLTLRRMRSSFTRTCHSCTIILRSLIWILISTSLTGEYSCVKFYSLSLSVFIFLCVCMCVCVCVYIFLTHPHTHTLQIDHPRHGIDNTEQKSNL